MTANLPREELEALDQAVERALHDSAETEQLSVLGYGEISAVIAWETPHGEVACKRLPPFADEESLQAYVACLEAYLEALEQGGVHPIETSVEWLVRDDDSRVAYCVQPIQASETLLTHRLAGCDGGEAQEIFAKVADAIVECVTERVGIDGQASNWLLSADGELSYLDVSTPMLRDDQGRDQLDTGLFIAALPWALRGIVRRFMLHDILDKYYDTRGILLDFVGNLHKEKLGRLIPPLLEVANERLPDAPLGEAEVAGYYRSDARMWNLLLNLRYFDRAWHQRILRRSYPFMLPGKVER